MNVDTGEFRALTEQAAADRESVEILMLTLAAVMKRLPHPEESAPERPVLRLIRGGRP